jgi:carbamoyl-phosphate synthase small subunit
MRYTTLSKGGSPVRALLALADGAVFAGFMPRAGFASGEVVFNTSMFGYQEMLTDPSYRGQILVLTTPHVGVVGTNPEDQESSRVWAAGLVVQDLELVPSNWRSRQGLGEFLRENELAVGFGFDTRAIVLHLRRFVSLPGALVATEDPGEALRLAQQALATDGQDLTR